MASERFSRRTLSSGLDLTLAPLPHLHTTTIALFVRVGSRFEGREDNGLSHFLEHMLFRGTRAHASPYELNFAIEELGGVLDGATHVDFTSLTMRVPPTETERALALLGEVVCAPLLSGIDIEKRIVREEILEGLDEDDRDIDVDDLSRKLLFSPHALGMKIEGSLENVERFTVADLERHLGRFYVAENAHLVVSGAVDAEAAARAAEAAFSGLRRGARASSEAPVSRTPSETARFAYADDEGSQADVRVSFPTFGERHPDAPVLHLLARVLDDGMSTRVHRRVIDERGLAYEAFADLDAYEDAGVLDFGASVAHEKTPDVVSTFLELARELRDNEVAAKELDKAKRRARWDLDAMQDDDIATASFHGLAALFGLEARAERVAERVDAVTASDLRRVANALLEPDRAHVTVVGDLDAKTRRATERLARKTR